MNPRPSAPEQPLEPTGLWRKIYQTHFHDYTPQSLRMWLAIVASGALALVGSLVDWSGSDSASPLALVVGLALVAAAAWFPIEIPRSKYSLGGADAFVFAMLAVIGMPGAVLAAGLEGAIGAMRSTRRWTSRISTPAGNMAAMWLGGSLFEMAWPVLAQFGWPEALAKLAVLPVVAVVPFTLASLALMSTVTLKRGQWPDVRGWLAGSGWMIAVTVGSGLLAGMVQLGAAGQGLTGVAIVGVGTLAVLLLLRASMTRIEAEHQAQECRIQSAQREAELNHRRFVAAFANAAVGMAIVDAHGAIVQANPALCGLLRRSESELLGAYFSGFIHHEDRNVFEGHAQAQRTAVTATRAAPLELRCDANKDLLWVELHRARFYQAEDDRDGLIYQLLDVTSRRVAEQRLHHIAYHDSLTDLANRSSFHERVSAAIEHNRLVPEAQFAVVFLDLDRFKVVNDSLGHLAGNELLREVARRLSRCIRPGDMVARLGGDEFAVLLNHMQDKASSVQLAEALLAELVHPVSIRGHEIVAQASAGITFSDLAHRTVEELLRDADLAMYEAKNAGRGRLAVYDRSMHERMSDKLALEADLRHAIGEGELFLAFQPLYVLAQGELVGFEALARWIHPTRGPVSPAVFIALAEESGHIEALTHWALNTALKHLTEWQAAAPELPHLGVSVNISGRDMARPRFVDNVLETLRRHGVAPHLLTLEITETVLMEHFDEAAAALERLHSIGVQLAIDDFGTGYSSLSYLSKLPIDCLKIDRSFVQAMDMGDEGVEIIRAVANLGRALHKKVVAEGIETEDQLATLRRLGVEVGQGYLWSRPVAADLVGHLLCNRM